MDTALIVARCLLAGVFAVAGAAKLADLPGSRAALTGFEVPKALVPAGAVALPLAELGAAVLLMVGPTAQIGAALAVLLLSAFVVGVERALRQGSAPECHCFGQLHSKPAGRETTVRNAVLALPALFVVVAGPGPGLISWADDLGATSVALVATSMASGLLGLASFFLWRDKRRLEAGGAYEVPDFEPPLPIGSPLPAFTATTTDGKTVESAELTDGKRGILVFASATCGPCHALLPDLARWNGLLGERLPIHVLSTGDRDANAALAAEHGVQLLLDRDARASRAFRVAATPSALVFGGDQIASEPVAGGLAIEALIRNALKREPARAE
jgi:uncharacterized membrane protein YphA (DoxX/SURF4 family)